MLKTDLHLHSREDSRDRIKYNYKQAIDHAAENGFDVISFCFHHRFFYPKKAREYAKKNGILLLPGVEAYIEKKEVLIYNITELELEKLKTFDDLRAIRNKKKNILIMAPHPFYPKKKCLFDALEKNIDLFDAIEFSHFYIKGFNFFNNKARKIAKKYKLPMVGTSDMHHLYQMGYTYTLIDAEKNIESVLKAIKKGFLLIKTRPIPWWRAVLRGILIVLGFKT